MAPIMAVFPGQGAQFVGMGEELFDKFEYHVQLADQLLGYSIESLCLHDDQSRINDTRYTQPALYVVNILHFLDSMANEGQSEISLFAGHSLGEFCALFAAGAFSFETGLKVVIERGRLMSEAKDGAMGVVLGALREAVTNMLSDEEYSKLQLANINTPTQHVVSGNPAQLDTFGVAIQEIGYKWVRLNVSGAFHSDLMRSASSRFRNFLDSCNFYPLRIPVISNVTSTEYPMSDREALIELLSRQLCEPVEWQKSMEHAANSNFSLHEYGPKKVLTGMYQEISQALMTA